MNFKTVMLSSVLNLWLIKIRIHDLILCFTMDNYVASHIIIHCEILTLFQVVNWQIMQSGIPV